MKEFEAKLLCASVVIGIHDTNDLGDTENTEAAQSRIQIRAYRGGFVLIR